MGCKPSTAGGDGATFMPGTPDIVFVLGGPGSGKGTQCAKLVSEFNFMHLSAGDLLRAERDSGSEQAEMINNFIKEGKIVPASVTVNLIKQAMEKAGWADRKYLIDGFPRNAENYEAFFSLMTGHCNVKRAIHFTCSEAILTERILERAKTSGRVDDNEETLKLRFATYRDQQVPILARFKDANTLSDIDCSRTIDEIFDDVKKLI